jgi:hypothetical protein
MNNRPRDMQEQPLKTTDSNTICPDPVASRRRLLKQATLAAPAILTLRSGAALAQASSCGNQTALNVGSVVSEDDYPQGAVCASPYNQCTANDTETGLCIEEKEFCPPGALWSSRAWTSMGRWNCN